MASDLQIPYDKYKKRLIEICKNKSRLSVDRAFLIHKLFQHQIAKKPKKYKIDAEFDPSEWIDPMEMTDFLKPTLPRNIYDIVICCFEERNESLVTPRTLYTSSDFFSFEEFQRAVKELREAKMLITSGKVKVSET